MYWRMTVHCFRNSTLPWCQWPPALAQRGELRGGQKCVLVKCLESVNVADRAICRCNSSWRSHYCSNAVAWNSKHISRICWFISVQSSHQQTAGQASKRIDIVSLKTTTRWKRGSLQRQKVFTSTCASPNWWIKFPSRGRQQDRTLPPSCSVGSNIPFLDEGKEICSSFCINGERVFTSAVRSDMTLLAPCNHE